MSAKTLIIASSLTFVLLASAAVAFKPEVSSISTLEDGLGPVVTATLL